MRAAAALTCNRVCVCVQDQAAETNALSTQLALISAKLAAEKQPSAGPSEEATPEGDVTAEPVEEDLM